MTQSTSDTLPPNDANSSPIQDSNRCTFKFRNGKRCRLLALDSRSGLCPTHANRQVEQRDVADLSADLLGDLQTLRGFEDVGEVLANAVFLIAQNRISPRRAAVLTFACNSLLRCIELIEHQPPQIFFDLPRPHPPSEPERQHQDAADPHSVAPHTS